MGTWGRPCPFLAATMLASSPLWAATSPALPEADRIRIAEAFRLADTVGERLWPGWQEAPFAVLLVTPEHEFLIRHPNPPEGFTQIGEDSLLKTAVWSRPRENNPALLATFPVGGVPTIVIGQVENTTAKDSTRWVVTLLHEHFHQLQNSQPGYYEGALALGLARGDTTGMWMLNYDFPYAVRKVKAAFAKMCAALLDAARAGDPSEFRARLASYATAKEKFRSRLADDDFKYFAFQTWQEGIARYTELRIAEMAAEYEPTQEFRSLKDASSFRDAAASIRREIEEALATARLAESKRVAFYPAGAAEGLLLDRADPTWRTRYFQDKFTIEPRMTEATAARKKQG